VRRRGGFPRRSPGLSNHDRPAHRNRDLLMLGSRLPGERVAFGKVLESKSSRRSWRRRDLRELQARQRNETRPRAGVDQNRSERSGSRGDARIDDVERAPARERDGLSTGCGRGARRHESRRIHLQLDAQRHARQGELPTAYIGADLPIVPWIVPPAIGEPASSRRAMVPGLCASSTSAGVSARRSSSVTMIGARETGPVGR